MSPTSIDSLSFRRCLTVLLTAAATLGLGACASESEPNDDEDCEGDDCDSEGKGEAEGDEAVCGDGVCGAGETTACADCSNEPVAPVCGNAVCEEGETAACSDCSGPPAASTSTIVVANYSAYTVFYFFAKPCSGDDWGPDLLGENVLLSGEAGTLSDWPAGCYDLFAQSEYESVYWVDYGLSANAGHTLTWNLQ
jgi:hypothetical protein